MDQILGYNQPQSHWAAAGRLTLGALVVALGWTVIGVAASAHASDEPATGPLGAISQVTTSVSAVARPVSAPVVAAQAAVAPVVTAVTAPVTQVGAPIVQATAPIVQATAPVVRAAAPVIAPMVPPVPAIVNETVAATTPPAVTNLITSIAGTSPVSTVLAPVTPVIDALTGLPLTDSEVLAPITGPIRDIVDARSTCIASVGDCVVTIGFSLDTIGQAGRPDAGVNGQSSALEIPSTESAGNVRSGQSSMLESIVAGTSTIVVAPTVSTVGPRQYPAPAAPIGNGLMAATASVSSAGNSAGSSPAATTSTIVFPATASEAPRSQAVTIPTKPADDLCSSPD